MNADVKVVDGRFVYGLEDCTCMNGKLYGHKPCPKCHGTDRTKGGKGKGRCKACFGGKVVDNQTLVDCERCHGTGKDQATRYSYIPKELLANMVRDIPIHIHRSNRRPTFTESYLGLGLIGGVTDYGRYKSLTDGELVDKIRAEIVEHRSQCLNYEQKDTGKLLTAAHILCHDQGYSVVPSFD